MQSPCTRVERPGIRSRRRLFVHIHRSGFSPVLANSERTTVSNGFQRLRHGTMDCSVAHCASVWLGPRAHIALYPCDRRCGDPETGWVTSSFARKPATRGQPGRRPTEQSRNRVAIQRSPNRNEEARFSERLSKTVTCSRSSVRSVV